MDRAFGLALAVVLVGRVVGDRDIERRQLIRIDQQMVMSAVRLRVTRRQDLHTLYAEFDEDVLADMGAVPRRDDEDFRAVRCLFARYRNRRCGGLRDRAFCILRAHSKPTDEQQGDGDRRNRAHDLFSSGH